MAKKMNQDEIIEGTEEQKTTIKTESKFSVAQLRNRSLSLFKVSVSAFDGATSGLAQDATYTIEEMKSIISEWHDAPVKKKEAK